MNRRKLFQSNDVTNNYSMNKQTFNKTIIGATNNSLKKWHDNNNNRDASNVTIKYKINEQGVTITQLTNTVQLNDVTSALRRVRNKGSVPSKMKRNTEGVGITPSFPVTPLVRTNNQLCNILILNKMAMLSKSSNNIQRFH
jgi:hypothetical protein